jgi:hypothetical protein
VESRERDELKAIAHRSELDLKLRELFWIELAFPVEGR